MIDKQQRFEILSARLNKNCAIKEIIRLENIINNSLDAENVIRLNVSVKPYKVINNIKSLLTGGPITTEIKGNLRIIIL